MDTTQSEGQPRIPFSASRPDPDEVASVLGALGADAFLAGGPEVRAFEEAFAGRVAAGHALAVSSGTAALHLALRVAGAVRGEEVFVSSLTPVAGVDPILYLGASPVFVDVDAATWTMDPLYLSRLVEDRGRRGRPPAAVVVVHLAGAPAELTPLRTACDRWEVPLIEDASEAIGTLYHGQPVGTHGHLGVFAFEGEGPLNTITGGMLVSDDGALVERARGLAERSREPSLGSGHREMGYDYRMCGLLAALGRARLGSSDARVDARRAIHARYQEALQHVPGLSLQPDVPWGRHSRRYSCLTLDPARAGVSRDAVRSALALRGIEARPLWTPAHLQPLYRGMEGIGGHAAEQISEHGLCLPSSSTLTEAEADEVAEVITACLERGPAGTPPASP